MTMAPASPEQTGGVNFAVIRGR